MEPGNVLPDQSMLVLAYKQLQGMRPEQLAMALGAKPSPTAVPADLGYARRVFGAGMVYKEVWERRQTGCASELGPLHNIRAQYYFREMVGYRSASGGVSSLLVQGMTLPRYSIPLLTAYETFSACKGCKGSNGGCPGFAPPFCMVKPQALNMFVIVVHIDMAWAFTNSTPGVHKIMGRVVRQLSYADRMVDSYANRIRHALTDLGCGYSLSLGNCSGCRPKSCTVIQGKACHKPGKRSYSMEATGIDVDALHYALYGEFLPWYYRGMSGMMPTYMSRYIAFFCEAGIDYRAKLQYVIRQDKTYFSPYPTMNESVAERKLLTVPQGVHAGYTQAVYVDPGIPIDAAIEACEDVGVVNVE